MNNVLGLVFISNRPEDMGILCYNRSKVCLPFGGRFRLIDFALSNCVGSGISDIVLLIAGGCKDMETYVSEWCAENAKEHNFHFVEFRGNKQHAERMLRADVAFLEGHMARYVVAMDADHIYGLDYRRVLSCHRREKAAITLGIGSREFEKPNVILSAAAVSGQKCAEYCVLPLNAAPTDLGLLAMCIVDKSAALDLLGKQATTACRDLFEWFAFTRLKENNRVLAYQLAGYSKNIDSTQSYYEANMALLKSSSQGFLGRMRTLVKDNDLPSPKVTGEGSIRNSIISPGCDIAGDVEDSVLSPNVMIGKDAVVRRSIIMCRTVVGKGSVMERCIVDEDVVIGRECFIGIQLDRKSGAGGLSVLGKNAVVPDRTALGAGCTVLPNVRLKHSQEKRLA